MFTYLLASSSFPQCPCSSRSSVIVRAAAYASDSGESLHCFLVGANKSYVIATSDLWLFIHASNLLPVLPTPLPYIKNKTNDNNKKLMSLHFSSLTLFIHPTIRTNSATLAQTNSMSLSQSLHHYCSFIPCAWFAYGLIGRLVSIPSSSLTRLDPTFTWTQLPVSVRRSTFGHFF